MCISVQLDAECELNSVASRSGFKTICNLGEERIRRAGDKIAADIDKENMQLELGAEPKPYPDLGFRVLRIDYSNFKDFYLTPGETAQESLFDFADNVKEGRSDLDLLFEVLPKLGIPYSAKIEERMLAGRNVVAVLGFNAQTVDTAHYLTAQGKKVTIVSDEPEEAFGTGQSMMLDKFVEPVFLAAGGSVRSESKLKSVGDGEVVLTTSFGVDITAPCYCVVDASNMVAGTSLADELSGDFDVVAVGDCPTPLNIQNAITPANLAARHC